MRIFTGIGVMFLALGIAGCGDSDFRPIQPTPIVIPPPASATLVVFRESGSGFSTSDVRDAQDQILQFTTAGEIIWTADGTRFKGHAGDGPINAFCQCWFDVRFGTSGGERRAYLTADYGHDNPGTVVDLEVVDGALTMSQTSMYPPGSYSLFGVVTAVEGAAPIEGADVYFPIGGGWRAAKTDTDGSYKIQGLYDARLDVRAQKDGYRTELRAVVMAGDTRFDFQLVRALK